MLARCLSKCPNECTIGSTADRYHLLIRSITSTDWRQVLSGSVRNVTCAEMPVLLDPDARISCSGHYVLTQGDVDEGMVTNEVGKFCMCIGANSRRGVTVVQACSS